MSKTKTVSLPGEIQGTVDREEMLPGEKFWVLQRPGTKFVIEAMEEDGTPIGPISFKSEDDAWLFARLHGVPDDFCPELVKVPGQLS